MNEHSITWVLIGLYVVNALFYLSRANFGYSAYWVLVTLITICVTWFMK
jgi:hypothetical protein